MRQSPNSLQRNTKIQPQYWSPDTLHPFRYPGIECFVNAVEFCLKNIMTYVRNTPRFSQVTIANFQNPQTPRPVRLERFETCFWDDISQE